MSNRRNTKVIRKKGIEKGFRDDLLKLTPHSNG